MLSVALEKVSAVTVRDLSGASMVGAVKLQGFKHSREFETKQKHLVHWLRDISAESKIFSPQNRNPRDGRTDSKVMAWVNGSTKHADR